MDNDKEKYTDEELEEIVKRRFPEKILVNISDYEKFISEFMEKDIIVSNVKPFDGNDNEIVCASDNKKEISSEQLSLNPGVYGFRRPSWFTSLPKELNKENSGRKTAANTIGVLLDRVKFWKKLGRRMDDGDLTLEKAMDEVDEKRRKLVAELLQSDLSNEEKYIKYLLLTPGMPRDFMKTFTGASELQLNANVVIELLEQPRESFNKEMIEAYVSEVRKGTEYNMKRELANELVRGEWYIMSDINGYPQKFQLLPVEYLEKIRKQLENFCDVLKGKKAASSSPEPINTGDFPIMDDNGDSVPAFLEEGYEEEEYMEDAFSDMDDIPEEDLNALIGNG